MELSLNKLPWYAQVGIFVALAAGLVGVFYYFYVMPAQAERPLQGVEEPVTPVGDGTEVQLGIGNGLANACSDGLGRGRRG